MEGSLVGGEGGGEVERPRFDALLSGSRSAKKTVMKHTLPKLIEFAGRFHAKTLSCKFQHMNCAIFDVDGKAV